MAEIQKVIKVGDIYTNLVEPSTGKSVNYKVVENWYDGTPMDDSKADGDLYRKVGDTYVRKVIDKDEELFLEKDTMDEMRNLSSLEILLLKAGVYKGITLNGYYEKGDTPSPIEYLVDNSEDLIDDGGSIIKVNDIYLVHNFVSEINILYYGVRLNVDNTSLLNNVIDIIANKNKIIKFSKGTYLIDATYNNNTGLSIPSNSNLDIEDGVIFKCIPNSSGKYAIITIKQVQNVNINRLNIIGDRYEHTGIDGEWGMGLNIIQSKNINIDSAVIKDCWGDGMYIGKSVIGQTNENIRIKSIICDNNRRQGISIITAVNLTIDYCECTNTKGTAPEKGVDIEPNHKEDRLQNINIRNLYTENNHAGGFHLYDAQLTEESPVVTINIENFTSVGEPCPRFSYIHTTGKVRGILNISNYKIIRSKNHGIIFNNSTDSVDVVINNMIIVDPEPLISNGVEVLTDTNRVHQDDRQMNLTINSIKMYTYNGGTNKIINVNNTVNNMTKGITIGEIGGNISNKSISFPVYSKINDIFNFSTIDINANLVITGRDFYTNINSTRPDSNTWVTIGNEGWSRTPITLTNKSVGTGFRFTQGGYIEGFHGEDGFQINTTEPGAYMTIECIDPINNIWRILKVSGYWYVVAGGTSIKVSFNAKPFLAEPNFAGNVKQANIVSNSATDASDNYDKTQVQSIISELRQLKTNLIAAGTLAEE